MASPEDPKGPFSENMLHISVVRKPKMRPVEMALDISSSRTALATNSARE
jgi:hypothetical protein